MNSTVTLIEVNSETSICECCGKSNLKRVAVLQLADGKIVRYGVTCAGRKLGKTTQKAIEAEIQIQDDYAKALQIINKWQYIHTGERIANHINVTTISCSFVNNRAFIVNGKRYQPEAYRQNVSWWAS